MNLITAPAANTDIPEKQLISLTNISVKFDQYVATQKISFTAEKGEFISIVGPSGCGKSTILNVICGLMHPAEGEVKIKGQSTMGIPKGLAYMFQRDALLPWKNVTQNVELALTFRGKRGSDAQKIVKQWIEKIGLKGFEKKYPDQLSGGMRKRVSLAQALVSNPEIVLMDEPFSALDVQTRNLMENELLNLWTEDRKTIIFVTHDLEEAIALSDRIILLTSGPGSTVKSIYKVNIERPRNVAEIKFHPDFAPLYQRIWEDLKEEVMSSYEKSTQNDQP